MIISVPRLRLRRRRVSMIVRISSVGALTSMIGSFLRARSWRGCRVMISSMMVCTNESIVQPAELLDSGRALASKAQQFLTFLKVRSL